MVIVWAKKSGFDPMFTGLFDDPTLSIPILILTIVSHIDDSVVCEILFILLLYKKIYKKRITLKINTQKLYSIDDTCSRIEDMVESLG